MTKQEALTAIASLAQEHGLTRADIAKILEQQESTESHGPSLIQKVMSYIGGVLVFCGICTYVGMEWDKLDSLSRVIITIGPGFVAFLLGLFTLGDKRFVRAATPLFLIGAFLQPAGLFVFMDEYLPPSGNIAKAASFVFGFMLIQQAIAFYARQRTSLLFFAVFFFYAFLASFMDMIDVEPRMTALTLGLSGFGVCWAINRSVHHSIAPFFFFFSALGVAAGSFDYLEDTPFDVLLIGVVAGMMYLSVLASSRTLLTVSVMTLLAYLIYYTDEYFKNVVGWPIAMVLIGLIMIGISAYAVKLGRRIKSQN